MELWTDAKWNRQHTARSYLNKRPRVSLDGGGGVLLEPNVICPIQRITLNLIRKLWTGNKGIYFCLWCCDLVVLRPNQISAWLLLRQSLLWDGRITANVREMLLLWLWTTILPAQSIVAPLYHHTELWTRERARTHSFQLILVSRHVINFFLFLFWMWKRQRHKAIASTSRPFQMNSSTLDNIYKMGYHELLR